MIRVFALLLALSPMAAWGQSVTPGTSPIAFQGFVVGNFYLPLGTAPAASAAASGGNLITCTPGSIAQTLTTSTLGVSIVTTDSTKHLQLAVYNAGAWGRPSTKIVSTADLTFGVGTGVINGAASAQLAPGPYWFCANTDSTTAILRSAANTLVANVQGASLIGSSAQTNVTGATVLTGVSIAGTYGTWPTFTSSTSWTDITTVIMPLIAFGVASAP